MKWKKSPQPLVEQFLETMESYPSIELKTLFGCPCFFINGNMFTGLHEDTWIVRLAEEDRKEITAQYDAKHFDPSKKGHPMKEYICLPHEIVAQPKELETWLQKSYWFASVLPPKASR